VNAICGRKISIVSDKPQTTRHRIMGVLTRPSSQLVFVDTPGLHKPVTALGERVNATALDSAKDVDATCLVLDATMKFGKGDKWVADHLDMSASTVIVNKTDIAQPQQVLAMLEAASKLVAKEYFPVSAKTGEGLGRWVAELVREQLLAVTHDELPYSIATEVAEWEWPRIRVNILVERDSQKGMVIGKGGAILKRVGELARKQMPEGVYLELRVKVDKDWQRKPERVERLGY
jgi:GTP-binding protein Era